MNTSPAVAKELAAPPPPAPASRIFYGWIVLGLAFTVLFFAYGPGPFACFDAPWPPVFLFVLLTFHWRLGVLAAVSGVLLVALTLLNSARTRTVFPRHRMTLNKTLTDSEKRA